MSVRETVRILLMEDDPGLARLFTKRLTREGYAVDVANDGDVGLAMVAAATYDVIVLDHVMPTMTGVQVLEALAAVGPLPPSIMVTGTGSEGVAVQALKLGASDYLVKDVDGTYLDLLPAVIAQTLQKARLAQEHAAMQTTLRESQRMLATLLDNLPGMAYRCLDDADWTMLFVSNGCLALTGYTAAALMENRDISYSAIIHPDDEEMVRRAVAAGLREGRQFQCEYRIVTASGAVKWVWEQGIGVPAESGAGIVLEGFITDISVQKRAEARLHDYSERLETMVAERTQALEIAQRQLTQQEKLAVLGQLAGGVGHELRTPLSVIKNAAYLMRLALPEPDDTVAEALDIVEHETDVADRIITDLLDFARTRAPVRMSVAPADLIDGALRLANVRETIEVTIDATPAVPPVLIDPVQIEQVLVNLITNAEEAIPEKGTITLRARPSADTVVIEVADTGTGIRDANRSRIFEPLFTTKSRGIGLGLVMCKRNVEANGGAIAFESEEGAGTTFTLTLPVAADA